MLRRLLLATAMLALMAGLVTAVPPSASAYDNSVGVVAAPDQVRKSGCASYLVRWRFRPPTDGWTVTAEIRRPGGAAVASLFWDSNSPNNLGKTSGSLKYQLCAASAPVGRYSISMQMIYSEGRDQTTVNRQPTYFKLVKRS